MTREDDRYRFVTSQLVYFNDKIIAAFSMFVKLFTAIAGGAVWLRLHERSADLWPKAVALAVTAFTLVGVMASTLIVFNLQSWWGFRHAEHSLTKGAVPRPVFPKSCRSELVMLAIIIAATIAGSVMIQRL